MADLPGYLSETGAHLLADRIRRYWAARGHHVEVWVEKIPDAPRKSSPNWWQVRSSLLNGLPPTRNDPRAMNEEVAET